VVVAQGGTHGGWSLYVKDNKPKFAYNYFTDVTTIAATEPLPAGRVSLVYDFTYDGGKPGSGGAATISGNGEKVTIGRIEHTIPYLFGVETADVGMDLYTPVTSDYAKGKNKFTGTIKKVTIAQKQSTASDKTTAQKEATASV
jgi:hypothetical protein